MASQRTRGRTRSGWLLLAALALGLAAAAAPALAGPSCCEGPVACAHESVADSCPCLVPSGCFVAPAALQSQAPAAAPPAPSASPLALFPAPLLGGDRAGGWLEHPAATDVLACVVLRL